MFLEGRDRSSVITLAGAASGIFDELVRSSGRETFLDYARRVHGAQRGRSRHYGKVQASTPKDETEVSSKTYTRFELAENQWRFTCHRFDPRPGD
jgi:hypothetical protein